LGHDGPPERAQLAGAWTGGLLADRGVNHDETTGGIDHDRLTAHAEEGEHRPLPREDPGLVAVAEERRRDARLDMTLLRPHASGLRDPGRRDDLDRKSTRLNSSHEWNSYAVFCLKKKKEKKNARPENTNNMLNHQILVLCTLF